MSQLGKDFKKGGAYIKKNNQIIYLEKFLKSGDILVYNGTSNHGVYEVDPDHKIEMSKLNGRVILMNSFAKLKLKKLNNNLMNKIEFINLRNKKKWQNLINYNEINPGQTWEYSKFELLNTGINTVLLKLTIKKKKIFLSIPFN